LVGICYKIFIGKGLDKAKIMAYYGLNPLEEAENGYI
jgi:hypothetical protein